LDVQFYNLTTEGGTSITVEKDGYATYYDNTLEVVPDQTTNYNVSLSPLDDNWIRFVLNWGAEPTDLDIHLITESGEHIYYGNTGDPNGGGGGSDVGGEGGSSGGTGGTYICTATFNANLIDFKQFRALSVYGEKLRRTDKHLMKAYDKIGPWVAKKMPKKIARKFSRAYLSAQYNNPSMFYKLITVTSRPIMRFIGRFL